LTNHRYPWEYESGFRKRFQKAVSYPIHEPLSARPAGEIAFVMREENLSESWRSEFPCAILASLVYGEDWHEAAKQLRTHRDGKSTRASN
jgi:hypothetical protein